MATDRNNRDAVADSLAAFLRGDLDAIWLGEKAHSMRPEIEKAPIQDAFLNSVLSSLVEFGQYPFSLESSWEMLRRDLAFLKSDFEARTIPELPDGPWLGLRLWWHLAALAAALVFSLYFGWWLFAAVWIASGTFGMILMQFTGRAEDREWRRLTKFYPFLDEAEWLAHQNLLNAYQLPAYDDWRHKKGIEGSWIQSAYSTAIFWLFLTGFTAFALPIGVLMWPLWVPMMVVAEFLRQDEAKQAGPRPHV